MYKYCFKGENFLVLSEWLPVNLGFSMIVWIVPIVPVVSINVQTIENILWKRYSIANDPDGWDDLDPLDRVEFYPDDRDDRVNFEAIIWKCS